MILLDLKSNKPIYKQIAEYFELQIKKGNIAPGEQIPSTSEIAYELSVSRREAVKAYWVMQKKGLISTSPTDDCGIQAVVTADAKSQIVIERVKNLLRIEIVGLREIGYDNEAILELVKSVCEE